MSCCARRVRLLVKGAESRQVRFRCMQIVNTMTETVKQGGVRRGANMGILSVSHPDILRFIQCSNDQRSLTNFNISVTVTDSFLNAVENGEWFHTEFGGRPWTHAVFDPKACDGEGGPYTYEGRRSATARYDLCPGNLAANHRVNASVG